MDRATGLTEADRETLTQINDKLVLVQTERWGKTPPIGKLQEVPYELQAIQLCKKGLTPRHFYWLSTSEELTVNLGLGRHDLLKPPYEEPERAWQRLDDRQRQIVRNEIGDTVWMR
jgi:hypothetical protein